VVGDAVETKTSPLPEAPPSPRGGGVRGGLMRGGLGSVATLSQNGPEECTTETQDCITQIIQHYPPLFSHEPSMLRYVLAVRFGQLLRKTIG
jgi:hypothetical protein